MARTSKYIPGKHDFPMTVPPDLNLDLHAFCQVFYNATKTEVTRRALRQFIDTEVTATNKRTEFEEVRQRLGDESELGPQLVTHEKERGTQSN